MVLPADYHMHTPLCRHASGEPTEYAATALERGLSEIGFSDHSPMAEDDFDEWRMRLDQLDAYVEKVHRARRDHPELAIKLALEVDFIPGHEDWIRDLAGRHPWDYFIGSVHYLTNGWDIDNPNKLARWRERDPWEVWSAYAERLTEAAASGLFDIIGHADLAKKFAIYPDRDPLPLFRRFLEVAARSGVAIELNTAGLRKDCREIYPSRAILAVARELAVPITFGSDAHAPHEVGADFAAAVELARGVGYSTCLRFARRERQVVSL
ncbi:MAG: histidinol-phosphatase HisJ family protein [Verrucomicrobia bacterium]|nr:histidinol-phosphatase HisJ family protein [Verrucomicrobiota bacterium]